MVCDDNWKDIQLNTKLRKKYRRGGYNFSTDCKIAKAFESILNTKY